VEGSLFPSATIDDPVVGDGDAMRVAGHVLENQGRIVPYWRQGAPMATFSVHTAIATHAGAELQPAQEPQIDILR